MNTYRFTSKRLLASALITTGLLGTAPVIGDELLASESLSKIEESISPKIESELCNHRFQCRKTGLIVHFLPDSKALFVHPESALSLKADYTVHFNRSMTVSVYENPFNREAAFFKKSDYFLSLLVTDSHDLSYRKETVGVDQKSAVVFFLGKADLCFVGIPHKTR